MSIDERLQPPLALKGRHIDEYKFISIIQVVIGALSDELKGIAPLTVIPSKPHTNTTKYATIPCA